MKHEEQLEQLRAQLASQDEAWSQARDALAACGDVTFAVPHEALEAIEEACAPRAAAPLLFGVRA